MANPFDAVTNGLDATSVAQQLQALNAINENLLAESVRAMQSTQSAPNSGRAGIGIFGAIGGALSGGLGISSMMSDIAGLFGGGRSSAPTSLVPYMQPIPIQLEAGFSAAGGGTTFATDSAEGNLPRAMTSPSGSSASSQSSPITVQVQAMDSQSFLDRSQDIAMAVRQAMLESTVLNDVIRQV